MSNFLRLPTGDKAFYRYLVENVEEFVGNYDKIAFGRYPITDGVLKALANEGLLKGKQLYFSSTRTEIPARLLSKIYGLKKIDYLKNLRKIKESDCLYASNDDEIDTILKFYDENILSKKMIVCDNRETVMYAIDVRNMNKSNVTKWDDIDDYEEYLLFESSDEIGIDGSMIIGNDMRGGIFKDYSLKDLKDIIYNSHMLINVTKSDYVQRIGDSGKKIIVEYEPGHKDATIDFLVDRLALLDDNLKGMIELKKRRYPAGPERFTRQHKNVLKVPYNMQAIHDRWKETPAMTETAIERHDYIGKHSIGLATHKKANMEILKPRMGEKPKTRFINKPFS